MERGVEGNLERHIFLYLLSIICVKKRNRALLIAIEFSVGWRVKTNWPIASLSITQTRMIAPRGSTLRINSCFIIVRLGRFTDLCRTGSHISVVEYAHIFGRHLIGATRPPQHPWPFFLSSISNKWRWLETWRKSRRCARWRSKSSCLGNTEARRQKALGTSISSL